MAITLENMQPSIGVGDYSTPAVAVMEDNFYLQTANILPTVDFVSYNPDTHIFMLSYLDAQVGKVLDKIKAMGEEDNTIVIFTSDNGPVTREARKVYELNLAGETDGLRGRKDNLWEGGIRVPAIIKNGKHLPKGMLSDTPVNGLDWMPTLAKMMNFK